MGGKHSQISTGGSGIYRFFSASEHGRAKGGENVVEDAVTQSDLVTMPAAHQRPMTIDEVHLERMTLGDRSLEREVLEIFARQTAMTLERVAGAGRERAAAAAHTLKGSARGIGAWRVAQAAERLEEAATGEADETAMLAAIAELEAASFEARLAIGVRLGDAGEQPAAKPPSNRSRDH